MNDLISKEDVKKLTKQMYLDIGPAKYDVHTISDCTSYVASKCRQYINEHLNDLPPVEQTEWTSVKDKLPNEDCECWITLEYIKTGNRVLYESHYDPELKEFYNQKYLEKRLGYKLIAWQKKRMPSPYTGE